MIMMDENSMQINVANNHTQHQLNRLDGKTANERRVLAQIDIESRNIVKNTSKTERFGQTLKTSKLSNVNNIDLRLGKNSYVNQQNDKKGRKEPVFQIYNEDSQCLTKSECDSKNGAISCENNRVVTELTDKQQTELMVVEEAVEEVEISEQINISCDESFMAIETDDESNSEQTSEIEIRLISNEGNALLNCKEYALDIHNYLLFYERKLTVDPFYMSKQPEINSKMRSILVDWMIEVTDEYKLLDETLFIAVNCIDRFLSIMSVSRQSFQLLGTTALFIASKYEEIYPPDLTEFVYITDDSYTKKQILNMEKLVLKALQFDVSPPTIHYFLEKFAIDLSLEASVKHLAQYLCYLTLLECEPFLQYYASEIAICSILLSAHTLGCHQLITNQFIESTTMYQIKQSTEGVKDLLKDRQSCIEALHKMQHFANSHPQQSIQQKYAIKKYSNASLIEAMPKTPKIY